MPASSVRLVSAALLACFVLQGCVHALLPEYTEPPRTGESVRLEAPERQPLPATVDVPLAPDTAASAPTIFSALSDSLKQAKALEAEAARLSSEADLMQQMADGSGAFGSPYAILSPLYSLVGLLDDEPLRQEIASKRSKARQATLEASKIRRQIADEIPSVLRSPAGMRVSDLTSHGILGGPNSSFHCFGLPFGGCIRIPNAGGAVGSAANVMAPGTGATLEFDPRKAQPRPARPKKAHLASKPVRRPPSNATSSPMTAQLTPAAVFAAESGKIDGLVRGSAAVSAPTNAKAGEPFTVYLRVSPEKLDAVLTGLKHDFPENVTLKGKQGIKLTSRMTAAVSGYGFEVSPKDGQVQAVSATEATTWQWQVKPVESGLLTLTFTLAGTLTIEGKEVPRNFYQYEQKVQVAVSPMGFMQQYWQWLATSLAIPAIGAAWAVFRRPKDAIGKRQPSFAEKLRERRSQRVGP